MDEQKERAAFEAWAPTYHQLTNPGPLTRLDGNGRYFYGPVNASWAAWQARAALAAAPAPAPGSVANEMREFAAARLPDFHGPYHMALVLSQKINEWADKLAAAPAPHPDTADAERWRHVWQCVRMAQHGEYVLMPDEPTGLPGDSLVRVMFLREVDAAIDAARAQAQGGKP